MSETKWGWHIPKSWLPGSYRVCARCGVLIEGEMMSAHFKEHEKVDMLFDKLEISAPSQDTPATSDPGELRPLRSPNLLR
jgi:hypothetical protein